MQNEKWKKIAVDILAEVLGSMLIALGLYNFALEAKFPMSGFSGLAMIIYRLFGLPIGVTTILLNIPVTILCFRVLGKSFFLRSLRCMVISSVCVDVIAPLLPVYALGALHGRAFGNRLCADLYEKFLHGRR